MLEYSAEHLDWQFQRAGFVDYLVELHDFMHVPHERLDRVLAALGALFGESALSGQPRRGDRALGCRSSQVGSSGSLWGESRNVPPSGPAVMTQCVSGVSQRRPRTRGAAAPRDDDNERGVLDQITPPEPPRLLPKPEQPLEPRTGHPRRGTPDSTREEVKAPADSDRHSRRNSIDETIDPEFLARRAERHQHQIRVGRSQALKRPLGIITDSVRADHR